MNRATMRDERVHPVSRQVAKLRQTLLRDDQTIKGLTNEDSKDLARTAKVTASSEAGAAKAALVNLTKTLALTIMRWWR